ncbi:hypothetical protein E6W39_33020 [Kitasatospora acidiphila]|uniref:Uncharacterized protein n=1 Tax=Kitasatospora acidiphila TaxID=2567942 RepID=A0A540WAW0_9ACTN|nr:hypothetical protein [Kitasatospora acidiphila]TQF06165.1 hypothetical protein E6W39_33020 [Kitasatospora acidiphila]
MDQPSDAPTEQHQGGTVTRRSALRLTAGVGGAALAAAPLLAATPAAADDASAEGQGQGSPLLLTRPESLGLRPWRAST